MASPLTQAAAVIEPHIDGQFRREDRAHAAAQDLADAGLLTGSQPRSRSLPVGEAAVHVLRCRHGWAVAEAMTVALTAANLLAQED